MFFSGLKLYGLRKLMQGEEDLPKGPLGNNFRPIQPINARPVRTNINFKKKQVNDKICARFDTKTLFAAQFSENLFDFAEL